MKEPNEPPIKPFRSPGWFWLEVWAGIALSGGAFGVSITFFDPPTFFDLPLAAVAFVFGLFLAGLPAVLVVLLLGSFSITFGLPTTRCGAAVAGAMTGLIAISGFSGPFPLHLIAGLFGAIGGGSVAVWRQRRYGANGPLTILGLMGRTTYFAVFFTVWRLCQMG